METEKQISKSEQTETISGKTFSQALEYLFPESLDEFQPLIPRNINIAEIRRALLSLNTRLELSSEELSSLQESKFRKLETGRGPGFLAALGDRGESIYEWCKKRSEGWKRIKRTDGKPREGSEGRGLRQLAADILLLAATPNPSTENIIKFCERTNMRAFKALVERFEREPVEDRFKQFGIPLPKKTFSSIPPGSALDLWEQLVMPSGFSREESS